MKRRLSWWGVSGLLAAALMVSGCTEPTQDPMAALVAAETVMAAIDGADAESALQAAIDAVAGLTDSQLASMVNLGLGADWSLEDAAAVKVLLAEVNDAAADALQNLDINENSSTAEVVSALADVGIEVSESQVDLLKELLGAVEGVGE